MVKVKQQFFKTAGGVAGDIGLSLSVNCKRVFATGYVSGSMTYDFDGKPHPLKGLSDIFVAGLDHSGKQKFFKTAGGIGGDAGQSITSNCDAVFLTGYIQGPAASDFNGKVIDVTGAYDIFVAGLDNCGKQKFFVTAGGNGDDDNSVQIVNDDKYVYIIGYTQGTIAYDFNKIAHPLQGDYDIVVAGLDHCGNQKFFVTAGGANFDQGSSLTVNQKGVFVSGFFAAPGITAFDGSMIPSYGSQDIFVAGLDKCGKQIFFKHAGASDLADGNGNSITSDCHNIYVTGFISGVSGTDFAGQPIPRLDAMDQTQIFVAGLDATCGKQKFFAIAGSISDSSEQGISITTNDHGVFVAGFIVGPNAVDFKNKPVKTYGDQDIFVAGLTKCGTQKFFITAGSSGTDQGLSITSNDEGIFVTGHIDGPTATDFCGNLIPNLQGEGDIFVAKLDFCGHQQYFLTAGSNQVDQGNQIVVRDNEIYVTGTMGGTAGVNFKNCPVTTLKGDGDIFVARLDDLCGQKRSKRSTMPYVPR